MLCTLGNINPPEKKNDKFTSMWIWWHISSTGRISGLALLPFYVRLLLWLNKIDLALDYFSFEFLENLDWNEFGQKCGFVLIYSFLFPYVQIIHLLESSRLIDYFKSFRYFTIPIYLDSVQKSCQIIPPTFFKFSLPWASKLWKLDAWLHGKADVVLTPVETTHSHLGFSCEHGPYWSSISTGQWQCLFPSKVEIVCYAKLLKEWHSIF